MSKRYDLLDVLRGIAIVLMIIYHFIYDFRQFGVLFIEKDVMLFWKHLPHLIVLLFFTAVGMSLGVNNKPGFYPPGFSKLCLKLFLSAAIISAVTYFMYPKRWVYFGTLHSILCMKLVIAPMRKSKWVHLILFLGIIIPPVFFSVKYPWPHLDHKSMDYIPLLPWIAFGFLGIYLSKVEKVINYKFSELYIYNGLRWLGRRSLLIYMIHQPILFGLVYLLTRIR